MATEKPEQDGFLAVIEKKIAALQVLATSYRAAVALGALGQPGEMDLGAISSGGMARSEGPVDLPQGALLGKSLPAAVKVWLTAVRRKQSVKDIAAALRDGGVESTSPNFENVVTGALHRLKANNEVLRFKDGWALADLYPASLRSSLAKDARPKRAKATARAEKKTGKRQKAHKATAEQGADDSKTDVILAMLSTDPATSKTVSEVFRDTQAADLGCSRDYVRVVLKRLRLRGQVAVHDGKFYRSHGRAGTHAA